jgi:hypothetical protein
MIFLIYAKWLVSWLTEDTHGNGITPPSLLSIMINFGLKVGSLGVIIPLFLSLI